MDEIRAESDRLATGYTDVETRRRAAINTEDVEMPATGTAPDAVERERGRAARTLDARALSTVIRNRVNLNRWSTTTSWGSGVGHRQTRASLDGVRGAGVKAVSPAKAGAERSDAP